MIISAKWLIPLTSPVIHNGAIRIIKGSIDAIGYAKDIKKKYYHDSFIELDNAIVMPGLVNAHSHIAYEAFTGQMDNYAFMEWIQMFTALKYTVLNENDFRFSAYAGALRMIKNAITTVADTCDSATPFSVARQLGMRMIFYYE